MVNKIKLKFEILYFIAKIRGQFPEIHEPDVYAHGLNKSEIKEICDQTGWTINRVSNDDVGFIIK